MKINKDNYLYFKLLNDSGLQEKIIKTHGEQGDPELAYLNRHLMKEVLMAVNWKTYLFSNSAWDIVNSIDVSKINDLNFVKHLDHKQVCFVMSKNTFVRMWGQDDEFRILHMSDKQGELRWVLFSVDIKTGEPSALTDNNDFSDQVRQRYKDHIEEYKRLLLYTFFSETEYRFIPGNSKVGKTRSDKVINQTPIGFTLVTSNWNTVTIRGKLVEVAPFWRMQACGKDWSERKPVLVKAHSRSKTIRAKKETVK